MTPATATACALACADAAGWTRERAGIRAYPSDRLADLRTAGLLELAAEHFRALAAPAVPATEAA